MKFCPECASEIARREIDGKSRFACSGCEFVAWGNPVPVVAVLVELGQHYVVARNSAWLWMPRLQAPRTDLSGVEPLAPRGGDDLRRQR